MCIHVIKVCVYTLLKVVSHYDLSVLSMYVMGFKKTFVWVGRKSIQFYFGFLTKFKSRLQGLIEPIGHCVISIFIHILFSWLE